MLLLLQFDVNHTSHYFVREIHGKTWWFFSVTKKKIRNKEHRASQCAKGQAEPSFQPRTESHKKIQLHSWARLEEGGISMFPWSSTAGKDVPYSQSGLPTMSTKKHHKDLPPLPLSSPSSLPTAEPSPRHTQRGDPVLRGPISSCTKDFLYQFVSKASPVLTWPGCSQRKQGCSRRQLERCFIWCCCFPSDSTRSLWSFIHLGERQLWEVLSALLFFLHKDKYSQGFCTSWARHCLMRRLRKTFSSCWREVMTPKWVNLLLQGLHSLYLTQQVLPFHHLALVSKNEPRASMEGGEQAEYQWIICVGKDLQDH